MAQRLNAENPVWGRCRRRLSSYPAAPQLFETILRAGAFQCDDARRKDETRPVRNAFYSQYFGKGLPEVRCGQA